MADPPESPTWDQLVDAARRAALAHCPGRTPSFLIVRFADEGLDVQLPLGPPPAGGGPAHSPDFSQVVWFGSEHRFTTTQARCVALLWKAWEDGAPEMAQAALLKAAGSDSDRLIDLFKGHAAFGSMVAHVGRGRYRLAEPES